MSIEYATYMMVILAGSILAGKLLRSKWPGWGGVPLLLLVVQGTVDLGVAPLVVGLSGVQYRAVKLVTRTHGAEALRGGSLILLCYAAIAAGLISVRSLSGRFPRDVVLVAEPQCSLYVTRRAWWASLAFFVIGSAVNCVILALLLRGRDISAIASERALYTDENLVASRAYFILQMLAYSMLIGALGMVLFSGGRSARARIGVIATFLTIGITALHGGRRGVLADTLCFLLIYRHGIGRIPSRRLACYVLIFVLALGAVVYARFGDLLSRGLADVGLFEVFRLSLVGYCRVDDAAWVLRTVPDVMPHTGVLNAAGALGRFIPGLQIPGTDTLYGYVVQHFYRGESPYGGNAGANYATGAELYSWGGWSAVVVFGYLIGLFFGIIFEWQRRSRDNPFILLLVVLISVRVFFAGAQARMPHIMPRAGIYIFFIAALAILAVPSRRVMPFVLFLGWSLVPLVIWKVLNFDCLRMFILCLVPLAYLFAVQSLRVVGTYFTRGEPRQHVVESHR